MRAFGFFLNLINAAQQFSFDYSSNPSYISQKDRIVNETKLKNLHYSVDDIFLNSLSKNASPNTVCDFDKIFDVKDSKMFLILGLKVDKVTLARFYFKALLRVEKFKRFTPCTVAVRNYFDKKTNEEIFKLFSDINFKPSVIPESTTAAFCVAKRYPQRNDCKIISFRGSKVTVSEYEILRTLEDNKDDNKTDGNKDDNKTDDNNKTDDQKLDDKKDDNKTDDQKLDDNKTDDQKLDDNKTDDKKDENKTDDQKLDDNKDDNKTDDNNDDNKTDDQKLEAIEDSKKQNFVENEKIDESEKQSKADENKDTKNKDLKEDEIKSKKETLKIKCLGHEIFDGFSDNDLEVIIEKNIKEAVSVAISVDTSLKGKEILILPEFEEGKFYTDIAELKKIIVTSIGNGYISYEHLGINFFKSGGKPAGIIQCIKFDLEKILAEIKQTFNSKMKKFVCLNEQTNPIFIITNYFTILSKIDDRFYAISSGDIIRENMKIKTNLIEDKNMILNMLAIPSKEYLDLNNRLYDVKNAFDLASGKEKTIFEKLTSEETMDLEFKKEELRNMFEKKTSSDEYYLKSNSFNVLYNQLRIKDRNLAIKSKLAESHKQTFIKTLESAKECNIPEIDKFETWFEKNKDDLNAPFKSENFKLQFEINKFKRKLDKEKKEIEESLKADTPKEEITDDKALVDDMKLEDLQKTAEIIDDDNKSNGDNKSTDNTKSNDDKSNDDHKSNDNKSKDISEPDFLKNMSPSEKANFEKLIKDLESKMGKPLMFDEKELETKELETKEDSAIKEGAREKQIL